MARGVRKVDVDVVRHRVVCKFPMYSLLDCRHYNIRLSCLVFHALALESFNLNVTDQFRKTQVISKLKSPRRGRADNFSNILVDHEFQLAVTTTFSSNTLAGFANFTLTFQSVINCIRTRICDLEL